MCLAEVHVVVYPIDEGDETHDSENDGENDDANENVYCLSPLYESDFLKDNY